MTVRAYCSPLSLSLPPLWFPVGIKEPLCLKEFYWFFFIGVERQSGRSERSTRKTQPLTRLSQMFPKLFMSGGHATFHLVWDFPPIGCLIQMNPEGFESTEELWILFILHGFPAWALTVAQDLHVPSVKHPVSLNLCLFLPFLHTNTLSNVFLMIVISCRQLRQQEEQWLDRSHVGYNLFQNDP